MNKKWDNDNAFEVENNLLKVKNNFLGQKVYGYFTTKRDGVSQGQWSGLNASFTVGDLASDVRSNRKIIAQKINKDLNTFVFTAQNHGIIASKITQTNMPKTLVEQEQGVEGVDCLYTYETGVNLCCFYADCTPIYFSEPESGLIGIIHAGWQGTEKLIVEKVLKKLKSEEGIDLAKLRLVFGPSIKKDSFEVQEDVKGKFSVHQDLNLETIIFKRDNESYVIDTVEFNCQLAQKAGVLEKNILITNIDTYQEQDLFSFRREGVTGRMIAIIGKEGESNESNL